MAKVTLYKEIITKTPGLVTGGPKLPFRSMRASWAGIRITIDDDEHHHLRAVEPRVIELPSGPHKFAARHKGFVGGEAVIDVSDRNSSIVAVSPDHRASATSKTPLGTLRVHTASPEELQPYAFYKGLPSSWGHGSVTPSVMLSVIASVVFARGRVGGGGCCGLGVHKEPSGRPFPLALCGGDYPAGDSGRDRRHHDRNTF